jgi:hypothetical protein
MTAYAAIPSSDRKGNKSMKKIFLVLFSIVVLVITVVIIIYGEGRDPRFYITMLVLGIVGKYLFERID